MATKSTRSAGSQITQRGITQGQTLVGPNSGLPFDEVVDSSGKRRLAVDANFTAQNVDAQVELDFNEDSIAIGDADTGNTLGIESDGSINANVELDAADGDNVAIQDAQGDQLAINPDGSINVNLTQSNPGLLKTFYNEVTSVANGATTVIQSYTAPIGFASFLQKIEISGTNIAQYVVKINGTIQDKKRTYFGASINLEFKFVETGTGLPLTVGDVVTVEVVHARPNLGDFNSRIQVIEV